jgi:membrane-bound serine protease (ClpP class)
MLFAAAALALAAGAGVGGDEASPETSPETLPETSPDRVVLVGAVEGAIGPAALRHVEKLVERAAGRRAEALVLRLDTPGGLTDSTRDIISVILGSTVPVIGWVAPPGAHAASAGTYILYATHLAAMAPGTNIGAATPVQLGGPPGMPEPGRPGRPRETPEEGDEAEDAPAPLSRPDAMTAKVTNDAVAFIRSLAELHGRNADWAEKAVREAATLSAAGALKENVIDLVAADVGALLAEAEGRQVTVLGQTRRLKTAAAGIEHVEAGTITRLLGVLSNPNVALVLMMIGIYGLIFEFMNPGVVAPGVIGAICLTLGLYSLNQLPLDYAGLALIGLGIAFMVAEALAPSFGVLGFGGLLAFVLGSAMLIDTDVPEYQISWWLIGAMAAVSGAVLILLLGLSWRAYRRAPARTSPMLGLEAQVIDWSAGTGHVFAAGERWNAVGPADLRLGERVRVEGIDGLTLTVTPAGTGSRSAAGTAEGSERWSR